MASSAALAIGDVRGPACRPSFSGRHHEAPLPCAGALLLQRGRPGRQRQQHTITRHRPAASADVGVSLGATSVQVRVGTRPLKGRGFWRIEEADDDLLEAEQAAPPPFAQQQRASRRTLAINLDLLLYRCRLARMRAQLSADASERRSLLREAENGLRRALSLDASDPRTYVVLGKLLVRQKRYDEARRLYADGTRNTGNANAFIWSAWGLLESRTGNVARARKLFDAAIVVDEAHAAAWHKWGMLEMRQGNYLRARDLWTAGIQKCRRAPSKSNTYLYCSLAIMAAELGKLGEARAWFEEGTRSAEGRASCALWHAWAMVEARIGDASAVRYLFKQALGANSRSRYAHLAWAMWERRQGNLRAALALLARGQALNPADAALYQALGVAEAEAGHHDAARAHFRAGLAVDPAHVHLWQAWGCLELERGDLDEARRLFQQGVWADPGSRDAVYVFHAWATLERRAGNAALARELFKAALKVDPKNEPSWGAWIDMEEEEGRLGAASELRIRRAEQQWEFVVPSSFSTRVGGSAGGVGAGADGASSASGAFSAALSTISRFFSLRGDGAGGVGAGVSGAANGASSSSSPAGRPLRELLPDDYSADLSLEDIIADAASIELPDGAVVATSAAVTPGAGAPGAALGGGGGGGGGELDDAAPASVGEAEGRMQRLSASVKRRAVAAATMPRPGTAARRAAARASATRTSSGGGAVGGAGAGGGSEQQQQ